MLRCVYLLAFVPAKDVLYVFNTLISSQLKNFTWPKEACQFFTLYVKKNWVGGNDTNARFPVQMWSMWAPSGKGNRQLTILWNHSTGRGTLVPELNPLSGFKREINTAAKKRTEILQGTYVEPNPGRKKQTARLQQRRKKAMSSYKKKIYRATSISCANLSNSSMSKNYQRLRCVFGCLFKYVHKSIVVIFKKIIVCTSLC